MWETKQCADISKKIITKVLIVETSTNHRDLKG